MAPQAPLERAEARQEVSSSEEARSFDWAAYSDIMIACLVVPRTVDDLVDYWKANANMLDWAKKVKPDVYERVRLAFADRRKQLERGKENAGVR